MQPKPGHKTGDTNPGQIYLIDKFVHGQSTRSFVFQPDSSYFSISLTNLSPSVRRLLSSLCDMNSISSAIRYF